MIVVNLEPKLYFQDGGQTIFVTVKHAVGDFQLELWIEVTSMNPLLCNVQYAGRRLHVQYYSKIQNMMCLTKFHSDIYSFVKKSWQLTAI